MRKRYTAVLLFFALILPGCGNKTSNEDITAVSVTEKLDADVLNKLKRHGISDEFVSLSSLSPDSDYWVFSLDSIVRFGPEDVLWLEEWPDEWFGLRSRGILFLYDPNADTLMMMAECEEVVNLYYKKDSSPVHAERREGIEDLIWSPDGSKILLVKDREQDGVSSQDILVFTLGKDTPNFLDVFDVWRSLVSGYSGKKGTRILDASWVDTSSVRVIFSVIDAGAAPLEITFDVVSGKAVAVNELPST